MKKVMLSVLGLLVLFLLLALAVLFINSPGNVPKLEAARDEPFRNSINEKQFVEINGVKQGMFLRGEDKNKPVLLFLHGGPGSPEFAMTQAWETNARLESEFVVCYWDQRGTGMSNPKQLDPKTLTAETAISDTVEVTNYLRERFDRQTIYLMGHSWGSYVGIKTVQNNPELYTAYLGIGQVVHQKAGQKMAYNYLRNHAKKIDDQKALKQLEIFDPEGSAYNMLLEDYGVGIRHDGPAIGTMLKNLFFFKGYTVSEKLQAIKGMPLSNKYLDTKDYAEDNLLKSIKKLDVPVYLLEGKYDYQVSQKLAQDFYEQLEAPDKKFYLFEHSAHSPNMEEPKEFMKAIKEIVRQTQGVD
ncbi:alpha/beta hydrolase [Enterococcus florum]|uniref:Alpha/beta hydrolase n=1 Tax=Enterococcus florum TaxID=2480627 RepID=A0A4P5P862_9ENTE|nr:alpha/beta hydrolase [Enterococcus florum]GCF94167.1 alpha/beta hydrolase [Enterococcus florum]